MFGLFRNKPDRSRDQTKTGSLIWACDYCVFIYHRESATESPYLQIVSNGRANELICEVGRGDEFADYEVSTKEDAIDSGLDVLHLYDVEITYDGKSDDELDCQYGEYGSAPKWLSHRPDS